MFRQRASIGLIAAHQLRSFYSRSPLTVRHLTGPRITPNHQFTGTENICLAIVSLDGEPPPTANVLAMILTGLAFVGRRGGYPGICSFLLRNCQSADMERRRCTSLPRLRKHHFGRMVRSAQRRRCAPHQSRASAPSHSCVARMRSPAFPNRLREVSFPEQLSTFGGVTP